MLVNIYRGKCIEKNTWVYGYFVKKGKVNYIYTVSSQFLRDAAFRSIVQYPTAIDKVEIDISTLSRFTDNYDVENKPIFENDIVRIWNGNKGIIWYKKGYWLIGKRGRAIQDIEWESFKVLPTKFTKKYMQQIKQLSK